MGPADGAPLLMIQGFSAQMIGWRDGFCRKLVERGLRVIRFDNRDVGLSEKFGGPDDLDCAYGLADMAADSFRVLDALDLPGAHIVGQSMGGMIAQIMAGTRPQRVRSLSLIYTTPGMVQRHFVPTIDDGSTMPAAARLSRAEAIDAYARQERMAGSPGYAFDEAWIRELGGLAYDRCHAPDGIVRQWRALMRAPHSLADLERLAMPAAVIHGRADGLIRASAGIELAARLPSAELHLYPGMGHEIVEPLWDEFANIIQRTVRRAAG
jgi:pimeloyl-ACP methyl ester carboxylesterase